MRLRNQPKTIQGIEKMITFQIVKVVKNAGTEEVLPVREIKADSQRNAKDIFYNEVVATGITETYQLHDDYGHIVATEGPEVFSMFA